MRPLPEPGDDWGGFRIDREIGRSARGRTFAAFDAVTRRTRALKVLAAVPSDDAAGERFQRHPLVASEIGHRNIVVAHAASDVDGTAFVVMDLYPLGSIADELGVSVLRLGRAREVLSQVAGALDAASAIGLSHGNVKPTNILCDDDGRVVVSDFGCTRFVDDALRRDPAPDDEVAGLPFHEAPEVLIGDPVGQESDVYSLTSVFYEMLTGRTPYSGHSAGELTEAHRKASVPRVTVLRPDLPDELDEFVARGMAKDPADRPSSAGAFVTELDAAIKVALEHRRAMARRPRTDAGPADPFESSSESTEDEGVDDSGDDKGPDPATLPTEASTYGGSRQARRDGINWRLEDGTIDGAVVGVFEDDPRRRWPVLVGVLLLVVAVAVIGWLVYRAAQADSDTSVAQAQQVRSWLGSFSSTM